MSEFNLDKVIQLLESAHDQGIHVSLAGDELAVRFQKGRKIEKKILEELKLNKPFLIHYFKTHANKGNTPSGLRLQKAERNELNGMQVSFAQERLWFIDQLEGSIQYHIPTILNLKGNLNVEALQYAIQQVINRHEVLRTVIREKEGRAWQYIKDKDGWQLNKLDGNQYKQDPDQLQSFIQQLINAPFNLANDYMLRAHLLGISEQEHVLIVTLHHIASDGWSNSIIVRELVELYNAYEKRETPDLLPLPIQYADFANWQRQYLAGELLEKKLLYWKEKLKDVSILQLPVDYERPVIQSTRGAAINFHINKDITEQVLLLSQEQGATLFMTLLAAFNVLLYRYTGQQDICVGTPIAGRDQQELEALIGFFVNSLALRSSLYDECSFIDLLKQVKTTTLEAYDHKELPFEKVVDAIVTERNLSRSPLFQVIFALQNLPAIPEFKLGNVTMSVGNFENLTSKYDLAFFITETNTGLHGSVRYCTDLFREETILRMTDHFQHLLKSILETPHQSIGMLEMITSNEKYQLLTAFNDTEVDYPTNKTIIDLFEAQVIAGKAVTAVVFDSEQLTYKKLNEQSNKLARFLKTKGVTEGTLVAIAMERSPELIVGILGILKAGGAYVPIDIAYPADRMRFLLDDTGVEIILTGNDIKHLIPGTDKLEVISLDSEWDEISNYSNDNLSTSISPESLAYVIYTSGSTGKPKGVMIEHKGVVNLALNQAEALQLTPQITTLQFASIGFDASCYEIFNTLLSGGKLVLPKKEDLSTAENFEACINKHGVHLAVLPPSFLHVIRDTLGTLKTIVSAGEALDAGIANEIRSKGIRLINAYGPTENTVCTSLSDSPVKDNNIVVIGKPISNVQVYILDRRNNLLPVGVTGELCIGGVQLARGYLNRDDLTMEKFIVNPFDVTGSTRLYRSGDLGRWLPDGNIEYLGRIDEQLKLRGYRIEPGEIESILLQSGMVSQAVVLLREDIPGSKRLACYVVPEGEFDRAVLVTYLGGKVPEYMIPSVWVELDRLPLTPNGKIDRKGLPVPEAPDFSGEVYVAPRNETEAQLSAVWKELLHVERVGIDDNFFELGGDSILTIQVVSRCRRLGLTLQPRDLFIHQTIRRLSAALAADGGMRIVGEQGILSGTAGLLPIQQWYLNAEQTDISYFNQGVLLGLDKSVTGPWLEESVARLVEQHDALRFRYSQDADNNWHQEYGNYKGEVVYEDLREQSGEELASTITARARFYQGSLDIRRGELVRVVWMETPGWESKNRLLIVIHHLAVDGVSWRILLDDLELLLTGLKEGRPLSPVAKSSSCRQWYVALEQYGKSRGLLKQLAYWELAAKSYKELGVDKAFGGVVKDKDIVRYTLRLDAQQTSRLLQEVPRVYHTEINDILLAALASTVGAWQGREEVNIGMEGHGREDIAAGIDLSRTVGWFTGLYPLHLSIGGAATPGSLIKSVKEQLRQLPDKGLGYGVLKYINGEKSLEGAQPWDIVFNYLGQLDNVVRESRLFSGAGESQGAGRSLEQEVNEKLSVNSSVRGGELILSWNYSSRHYDSSTIESLSVAYLSKLEELISHCVEQLKEGGVVYTPSDYGLGGEIGYEELDNFLAMPVNGQPRREQITGLYRLSGLQQGMLFHGLYEAGIGAYIEQFGCELTGVDLDILRKSWAHLIARHSILRSAFYVDAFTVPVQCVYKEVALPIVLQDYREMTLEEQAAGIKAYYAADKQKGFDFKTAPLMRIGLFRLSEERYRMVWTLHHILFDGWSLSVLMEEFLGTYESLASGEKVVAVQEQEEDRYEDYIRYIERSDKEAEEQYWRHYLQGISEHTLLPFIGTTADRNKGAGSYDTLSMHITGERVTGIHSFVQRHHLTLNTLMQGVWAYLLHRYTGNTNIVYGVVVSGRPDDLGEVEQRVGMYINTLPLHSHMNESVELINWLQSIQSEQVSSRQYQHTPLHVLQGWSGVQGDLFDSLLTFENYPVSKAIASRQSSLNIGNVSMQEQTNYPLSIIIGAGDQINIHFSYNTRLLEAGYVRLIRDHFENVLQQFTDPVKMRISDISLLTLAEEEQLLRGFNTTAVAYEQDKSIVDLFEEQVKKSPDSLAVVFKETKLSYGELNSRCNQLGHYLRSKGVAAETVVPVCMDRSVEMLVGILGILKAGGAYVPIDPGYPAERIGYMLEDTGATLVLTTNVNRPCLASAKQIEIIELDSDIGPLSQYPSGNLSEKISPAQLAYIIYTSGSTGKPKGVMIEHGSLFNYITNNKANYINTASEVMGSYLHLSYTFDASLTAMFMPLCFGKAVVVSSGQSLDIFEDENLLKYAPYDFIKITPAHLELIQSKFNSSGSPLLTQKLVIGGEALHAEQFDFFLKNNINVGIVNEYGPTEATVGCTTYNLHVVSDYNKVKSGISIGKPIDNVQIYILDSRNNLLPVGVWGELCIGGLQLARGYLNRGDLTLEKFMVNPFDGSGSTRLYRSGDLGRWLPDGNIEYLGRVDEQVKLRGYRIELGEIESVLLQSGMVRQAVVLLREDNPGSKRLACYVVPEDGFDKTVLVTYLGGKVPEYMIPSVWVELDRLPLTPNGKIDRKGLPVPEAADFPGQVYMAPRNETEAQLSAVWKELLHVDRVGIDDNFFELGGDSILTIQVVSRCRRLGLALQPRELFIHQTIRRLSAALAEDGGTRIVGEQGILSGSAGLLPIQQWYLNGEQTDISYFNQGVLLGLDKSVTGPWLEESVTGLLEQHDALRFRYSLDADNKWHQEYGSYKGEVFYEDLREQSKEELASTITARARFYQGSLDISRGELVRVVWMETPGWESRNRLLLVIHHLAVDGVSWRILLDDLELLLTGLKEGRPLSPGAKSSSCRQWYGALEQYGKSPGLLKQLPYWALAAKSYEELRVDKAFGGVVKDKDIARYTHRLDAQQTSRLLQEVPRVYHTEINDILLAALASTVGEWQGREEVNIGMEGHGREDIAAGIDLSRTVGWFTGLYPLHLSIVGAATPGSLIKSVKEQLRQLPAKGLGYGVLKYINGEKSLDGPQPWDIVFNYLGQLDNVVRESRLFFGAGESQGSGRSIEQEVNEKISVNSSVRGGELILSWSYSSRHYDSSTIESLSGAYLSKLEELISHCIEQLKEGGVVYTPSDYGLGGEISYEELDNFLAMPVKGQPRREQITGLYRLSGLQQGMLFHGLYEAGIGAYIEQFGCELTGVDLDILRKSWGHLIARHSILRSAFYVDAFTVPVQCVYKEVALPIVLQDYREMTLEEQAAGIKAYYAADKQKGFDFKTAPLMRIGLFRLSEERYRMVWTLHHILFDGWSLSVLMEEFLGTYESLASGEKVVAVQAEEDRYEDYIRYIERSDKEAEEQYWRHYLQGISEHTLLPFIGTTADRNKGAGSYDTLSMHITGERVTGIHSFVQRHHLTLNTLMQGVWAYLLHRYTGNTNIVYGVVVSGRPDDLGEVEQRVGMYINTLPLHSHMNESVELINWLQSIQSEQVSSRQYQHTPLHVLQGWSGVQGDLFDSLLTFENYPVSKAIASRQSSLNIGNVSMQEQTNYPLSIIIGAGDQINIHFSYNTRLLEAGYVRLIRDHFENVLQQFTDPVKMRISDISLLTLAEEEQLLRGFNTTAVAYEQDKSIVDLFEEQVKKSPDALAVVFKETKLSYGELNSRCNQLGHYLRSKGVAAETVVPVCMDRSVEMLVGILGILKAGGAYVPIDPGYPAERIGYMLEDTGATLVLTTNVNRPCLASANQIEIIELDSDIGPLSQYPSGNLSEKISPAQLAYIIYTSGSTGKPKGVMIEHKNLANLVYWHNQRFLVSKASRATVMAGVGFDALGWEIWPYLATGASLYLVNDDKRANLSELVKTLIENNITHSFIATAILPDFIEHTRNKEMTLQYVLTGGDKLQWVNIEGLPYKLINNYGPTENTVVTSSYELINNLKHPIPPIGKPISNTVIYLLNEKGKLVPPGVSGELYIGGAGLGRGYLNLPELTSDKFVNDFINKIPGQKLYRSGDLGRWLLDGNIEYMGRMDQQVKIRGYRIELGEIEQVVQTCPIISQSIVAVKEDKKGNKRLVGYVITKENFNPEAIIAYLKPKLPAYMIPVAWVEMETFPLTPNGKINLKALPDTGIGMLLTTEYVAPRTELEEKLAAIWKELLLVERVGINDNFFELGGHSLMAMRMVAYIERSLLVTIPIKVLFQFTCISDLSKYLEIQLNSSSDENIIPYKLYDI